MLHVGSGNCSHTLKRSAYYNLAAHQGRRARLCPAAAASPARWPKTHRPPGPPAGMKLRLQHMFEDTHQAMLHLNARVLDVRFLNRHSYYFRHPDDIQYILNKDGTLFAKSKRVAQSTEFLGAGIFSQLDYNKHAAMRHTLNPAFRKDYLKQLDKVFIVSACQLADMLEASAAADVAAPHDVNSNHSSTSLDMQQLFRLLTLDSIGLTSMKHDFKAMHTWQQQRSNGGASGNVVRVEQMLRDLSDAFIWQSLQLPVPRSWLPGWGKYIAACDELNNIIHDVLAERRACNASTSASAASVARGQQQDIVDYLLQAQQQQGCDVLTDNMIGDEIKTMMFGGSDTSSFTLAALMHYFAAYPVAADRAADEVAAVLQDRGGDVTTLSAEDCSRMPFVTACVNETLRLAPAGPTITRTATQEVEIAGYRVTKGQDVVSNIWAMHRHPDVWPQPDD